jgi:Taurine catabolism dioxygenase TauD, TfdA family
MTVRQADALDAVHFAAEKHALAVKHIKGDIFLINNLATLHGREAFTNGFEDKTDGGKGRHLMRLWLRDPRRGKKIPTGLQDLWEGSFGENARQRGKWQLDGCHGRDLVTDGSQSFS